jgi:predicted N-formylglutamate amidohydrolase
MSPARSWSCGGQIVRLRGKGLKWKAHAPLPIAIAVGYSRGMARDAAKAVTIAAAEQESYVVLPGRADAGLVILCDHAGNALPPGYGTLGLPAAQLARHIAYDIGAAAIARALSQRLGVPALLTRFSRLLIDPNRGCDDPTLIMRLSDGAVIPGNRRLDAAERDRRIRLYYAPYHRAIDAVLDGCLATGVAPAILSLHSFTESWKTRPRPWHVGVLWDRDDRLAKPLLERLYAEADLIVGDNQPYSGQLEGDCLWQHGTRRGLVHALIEVRQDLIRDAAGQAAWAERLRHIVESILGSRSQRSTDAVPSAAQEITDGGVTGTGARITGTTITGTTITGTRIIGTRISDARVTAARGDESMHQDDAARAMACEAAAFRRLLAHLRARSDVQNIDLMNLAGFCRNCLADWYREAARDAGVDLNKEAARELIYGMPYSAWQASHQKPATPEQAAAFAKAKPHEH